MGVDLALLPFDGDRYSFSVLECERRRELWDAIRDAQLPERDVPEGFSSYLSRDENYEDVHYGVTLETPYGEPLKYVQAKHLMQFAGHESVRDNARNRSVWAYIKELPPDTKVALYWH